MPPIADFSRFFNSAEDADTMLHLSTVVPETVSKASGEKKRRRQQQHDRTYHVHSLLLKAHSSYFKACLAGEWQQPQQPNKRHKATGGSPTPGSTAAASAAPPGIRYELVEHVEAAELDAMEQLLRLMYCQAVPAGMTLKLVLQMLCLADRYQAVQCADLLLTHLAGLGKDAVNCKVALQLFNMPPGVQGHPAFRSVLRVCQEAVVRRFPNVPSVIQSDNLRQQFCELPHAAVLAWAGSDKLLVQSENCVVYLLSAWVKAQQQQEGGESVSAAQLEQLAHQVRVLQLGPAYQFFVLPHLEWFKGCSGMAHLSFLLAYKGATSTGKPVYPSPARGLHDDPSWRWDGPAAWVAGPRQLLLAEPRSLNWDLGPEVLQQLYEGRLNPPVQRTPHLYVNGFQLMLEVVNEEMAGSGQGHTYTLGVNFKVSHQMMSQHGVPWPDTASVSVNYLQFKVNAVVGVVSSTSVRRTLLRTWGATSAAPHQPEGWGACDILRRSAPTLEELVAPLLVDGKLRLEMRVEGVDDFNVDMHAANVHSHVARVPAARWRQAPYHDSDSYDSRDEDEDEDDY